MEKRRIAARLKQFVRDKSVFMYLFVHGGTFAFQITLSALFSAVFLLATNTETASNRMYFLSYSKGNELNFIFFCTK